MAKKTKKITKEEIEVLLKERGLDVMDVIDVIVDINGIIGVGLISLGDALKNYCYDKFKR